MAATEPKRNGKRTTGGERRDSHAASPSSSRAPSNPYLREPEQFIRDHRIRETLGAQTINRDSTDERFISHGTLIEVWGWDILTAFLATLNIAGRPLVTNVRKNLIKTISVLASIKWQQWEKFGDIFLEYLPGTLDFVHNDTCLPYALATLEDQSFLGSDSLAASEFFYFQHLYIPIVIEEGTNKVYPRTMPLPFIKSERVFLGEGGYGSVTKEVVECYQYRPMTKHGRGEPLKHRVAVARKWFEARGNFHLEAKILEKFNSNLSQNERIVQYLAIITTGDENDKFSVKGFNILSPLADTDLKKFLYEERFTPKCCGIKDLVLEAAGLAHAIEWLHKSLFIDNQVVVCCHMDLKLDNVLVYFTPDPGVGRWKIADFGISSIVEQELVPEQLSTRRPSSTYLEVLKNPAVALSRITGSFRTSAKRPAGPYSAPEVANESLVGTPSDIWSLGCILCQVLARAVGGITLLKELDQKRAIKESGSKNDHFCQRTHSGESLHRHINTWLESHHSLPDGTFSERTLVMNCKRLILRTLQIDPKVRPNAREVHLGLLNAANGRGDSYTFDKNNNLVLPTNPFNNLSRNPQPAERPQNSIQPLVTVRSPTIDLNVTPAPGLLAGNQGPRVSSLPVRLAPYFDRVTENPVPQRPPTLPPEQQQMPHLSQHIDNSFSSPVSSALSTQPRLQEALHSSPEVYDDSFGQFLEHNRSRDWRSVSDPTASQPTSNSISHLANELQANNSRHSGHELESPCQDSTFPALPPRSTRSSGQSSGPIAEFGSADGRSGGVPFPIPKPVIATLISSARAMVAFVTPNATIVYALHRSHSYATIETPENCEWEKGAMAGNYLALRGVCASHTQPLYLYRFSCVDWDLQKEHLDFKDARYNFEKFAIAADGKILLGFSREIWLYQSHNHEPQKLEAMDKLAEIKDSKKLQQVWFSTTGRLVFARISLPNNMHHFRVWETANVQNTAYHDYQVPASQNTTTAIKAVIPFPRTAACLLWKEHDHVSLIQFAKPSGRRTHQELHLEDLQAAVVTPHENAIIFICAVWKRFRRTSEISVCRLVRVGNCEFRELSAPAAGGKLERALENVGSDVVIEAQSSSTNSVRLIIAHNNGSFEIKDVAIPG